MKPVGDDAELKVGGGDAGCGGPRGGRLQRNPIASGWLLVGTYRARAVLQYIVLYWLCFARARATYI